MFCRALTTTILLLGVTTAAEAQRTFVGGIMSAGFTPLQFELTASDAGNAFYSPLTQKPYALTRVLLQRDTFAFEWSDEDGPASVSGSVRDGTLRGLFRQGSFTGPVTLIRGIRTD